ARLCCPNIAGSARTVVDTAARLYGLERSVSAARTSEGNMEPHLERCDAEPTDAQTLRAPASGGRTTVTVHAAPAATSADTLPSSERFSELCRAPIRMWLT